MKKHPAPLQKAVALCGSQAELARRAGVQQPSINKALTAKRISAELAVKVEKATNGAVTRWELRPDLWPKPQSSAA